MRLISRIKYGALATALMTIVGLSALSNQALAATSPFTPPAKISFTFDDGLTSAYTNAAPILKQNGLVGTDYVITGCVGMTTQPNTCRANTDTTYMPWSQIQSLQNSYGWEIGSHTVDHDCLASDAAIDPSDCQAGMLTAAQVTAELANSKSTLVANGLNVSDFSPPYGSYNNAVLAQIAKYYASMRQFANASGNTNSYPYSDYYLWDTIVQQKLTPVATIEADINKAITNHQWIILTFHNIETNPSGNPDDYEYGTAELSQIAAYVKTKITAGQIENSTISQAPAEGPNLMPNPSFNSGIGGGWSTDAPSTITANSGNNGSWPDSTNSVKLTSTSSTTHLFSPQINVTPGDEYVLKNFLNVSSVSGGLVGFYIDEYDGSGNWISGQWKAQENSQFVEDMNFTYTPTSANVSKARLQVVVSANPGTLAYLDNSQWIQVYSPAPATDLMPNSSFSSGISGGWTTDDATNISADSGGNGSPPNPEYSVKLVSNTANTHLFSPKVPVSSASSYQYSLYLNIKQILSGDCIGFYIDEYNSSGQWISGQYKLSATGLGPNNYNFSYTPSSANVTSASLQVIVMGGSNTAAYITNIEMTEL